MNTFRCALALTLVLTGCNASDLAKLDTSSATPEKASVGGDGKSAGGTQLEGLPLIIEKLPDGLEKNDYGAGFHSKDESFSIMVKHVGESDPKDMEAAKKATEEMFFKKWIKSDKAGEGWVLTWLGIGLDMQGKDYDLYSFSVRFKAGGHSYDCYGGVKKQADVEKNVQLCQAIKPAP
ncbi:MAG: hypothetical protein HOV80_38860 [Polyangiaceae bacterium]|nr:hypothetical protein [Polyangiaceae bacterium]